LNTTKRFTSTHTTNTITEGKSTTVTTMLSGKPKANR
jgi:hypothetical protein